MDHGVEWQTNTSEYRQNRKDIIPHFDNKEEKRVITGSEYKTATANKEIKPVSKKNEKSPSSYRSHNNGSYNRVKVNSPISNKKIDK